MATEGSLGQDVQMYQSPPAMPTNELRYGGFTRFEIELEFVQSLASPFYINYLASEKYFDKPAFIAYLNYLLYFTKPPYLKFLTYPGPTLRNLELLQNERFRTEILDPAVAMRFWLEGMEAAKEWPNKK